MLLSLSLPLPQTVGVHGFVVGGDERKMSKSLGNVVDPVEVLTKFGADAFRLFVLVDSSFGGDLRWSQEALGLIFFLFFSFYFLVDLFPSSRQTQC